MNRKQKAMEERYRSPAPKYANPGKNIDARKLYTPTVEVRLAIRKRNKLAELLEQSNEAGFIYSYKSEAVDLLKECSKFKTLEEWNEYRNTMSLYYFFGGTGTRAKDQPTKAMQLTWDVHTGVALTKLYNSLY